jgi:hypothetical protein
METPGTFPIFFTYFSHFFALVILANLAGNLNIQSSHGFFWKRRRLVLSMNFLEKKIKDDWIVKLEKIVESAI